MDFLRNVFSIVDSRTRQMKKQAEVDQHLSRLTASCPDTVALFLLEERKSAQMGAASMDDKPIRDKALHSIRMLQDWDRRYAELETTLTLPTDKVCGALQETVFAMRLGRPKK